MIEEVVREIRSDIHEIKAKAKKPFQDHFWKDHFCDSGSAAADCFFLQYFPLAGKLYSFCICWLCACQRICCDRYFK